MSSILLIQSDPSASARLRTTLDTDPSLAVFAIADTLGQAQAVIARRVPDLLIADLRLADGLLVDLLDRLRPGRSHVLVLAASLRNPLLVHALRQGADAYWLHGRPPDALLRLVRRVLAGESPMAPEIARQVLAHHNALDTRPMAAGLSGRMLLTEAERRMLGWISEGYLMPEVARGLGLTPERVGRLVRSVYRRLHADSRSRKGQPRLA